MSEIYLPSYISSAQSINDLISSKLKCDLVIIRIRNYKMLEIVSNPSAIDDMKRSVKNKISEFYFFNKILDINIISVQDHIFIHSSELIVSYAEELKNAIDLIDFPFYISFQLFSGNGDIAKILPRAVQQLAYSNQTFCQNFDENGLDIIANEYRLLRILQRSLSNKTAGFAYQPVIDSKDGGVVYYECLMRIPNDSGEWISAGSAIILAEKFGVIDIVDRSVIEMAAEELRSSANLKIAVNISNIGILNDSLLEKIENIFSDRDIATRLIIEITETSANQNIKKVQNFVNKIRNLGIRVALDDFGGGVTSFKQLCTIKFDIIKIDGSFIKGVANNPYHRFITEMVIKLSKESGAKTVAEFVENGEVAKILMNLEVDYMQGHFFSPAQNFRNWNKVDV